MAEHLVVRGHELDCDVRMAFLPSEGAGGVASLPRWLGVGIEGIIFFGVSGCCLDAAALVMRHKIPAVVVSTNAAFMIAHDLLRGEKTLRARMPSFVAFDVWPLNARPDTPKLHGTITDCSTMGQMAFDWLNDLVIKGCRPGEQGGKRVAPVIWQDGETLKPLN